MNYFLLLIWLTLFSLIIGEFATRDLDTELAITGIVLLTVFSLSGKVVFKKKTMTIILAVVISYGAVAIVNKQLINMAGLEVATIALYIVILINVRENHRFLLLAGILPVFGITTLFLIATLQKHEGGRFVSMFGGGLSIMLAFSIFALLYLKRDMYRIISLVPLSMLLLYQSRMAMLTVLLLIFLSDRSSRVWLLIISVIAISVMLAFNISPETRLLELNTSGRLYYWKEMISEFNAYTLLFGHGDGQAYQFFVDREVDHSIASPHNEYLRITYDAGLLVLIALIVSLIYLYRSSSREARILVLCLCFQMLSDVTISYFSYILYLFIAISYFNGRVGGQRFG